MDYDCLISIVSIITDGYDMSEATKTLSARSAEFLAAATRELKVIELMTLPTVVDQPMREAERIKIGDASHLTPTEVTAFASAFNGPSGMAAFECLRTTIGDGHPLTQIGSQLREVIPSRWPVNILSDETDGTTKIRDAGPIAQPSRSLTNQALAAHQDGWLSLRGVLAVTGLWADSGPAERAATYSQNIFRLAIDLWRSDEEAFIRLFADNAVMITSPSGHIAATSPVVFTERGRTHTFFRAANDEYAVRPGAGDKPTRRAIDFMIEHTSFGANGSVFTYLDRPGRGLLLNNKHCVHGRTAFVDGALPEQKRIIASKWWASDHEYRDVVWNALPLI